VIVIDSPVRDRRGIGSERGLHPFRLAIDWADRIGFRFVERLAYARMGITGEYLGRFRNDFEPMLWFQKPGGASTFDKTHLRSKMLNAQKAGSFKTCRKVNGELKQERTRRFEDEKHAGTIWQYLAGHGHGGSTDLEGTGHHARFPYRLASDAVRCWSNPDDLVCDPFSGSGTTALACYDHGRRFIGGDLLANDAGKPWAEVALEIIGERAKQGRLFMPPAAVPRLPSTGA
jgi:DNA modification methylase